jgi:hypothetical protein
MPLDAPHAREVADQKAVADHGRMIFDDRLAEAGDLLARFFSQVGDLLGDRLLHRQQV